MLRLTVWILFPVFVLVANCKHPGADSDPAGMAGPAKEDGKETYFFVQKAGDRELICSAVCKSGGEDVSKLQECGPSTGLNLEAIKEARESGRLPEDQAAMLLAFEQMLREDKIHRPPPLNPEMRQGWEAATAMLAGLIKASPLKCKTAGVDGGVGTDPDPDEAPVSETDPKWIDGYYTTKRVEKQPDPPAVPENLTLGYQPLKMPIWTMGPEFKGLTGYEYVKRHLGEVAQYRSVRSELRKYVIIEIIETRDYWGGLVIIPSLRKWQGSKVTFKLQLPYYR